LLAPITGLTPLPTRLATIFLFVLTVVALCLAARESGIRWAALRTPQLLGAPMLYGSIGTALTEMPAMFVFAVHTGVLLLALRWSGRDRTIAIGLGIVAGLCCGLATAGRQTYLASLPALAVLGWRNREAWWPLAACVLSSLILPIFIFVAWRGLTPPRTAFVGVGFSVANVFTAFAYAGLVYAVLDSSWIAGRARLYAAVLMTGLLLNLVFGLVEHTPLQGTVSGWLPPSSMRAYSRVLGGLFLGWGLVSMVMLFGTLREPSTVQRYLALASILILGSALKVTIPYGGRYIAGSLPLLLLLALHRAPDTNWKAVRLAIAAVVGLISLNTYIMHSLRLEARDEASQERDGRSVGGGEIVEPG